MKISLLLLLPVFLFLSCSKTDNVAGTLDETGTGKPLAVIMGLVVYENSQPVSGASVNLYSQNSVKKIVVPLQKRAAVPGRKSTFTNINGIFRIDSVDTGRYFVDINDHDSLGALVETKVDSTDTLVTVSAILKRLGNIQGKIDGSLVSKNGNTYIYIVEIQRRIQVDSTGMFEINNVPAFNYDLRVMHDTIFIQSPLDTLKAEVIDGDTTRVGNFPPQALIGVDSSQGIAPFATRFIFKASDPDNDPLSVRINYGDGEFDSLVSASGNISHVYTDSGTFKVTLIANDGKGGSGEDSVIVRVRRNFPPLVQLAGDTNSGFAPFSVKLIYKITDPDNNLAFMHL